MNTSTHAWKTTRTALAAAVVALSLASPALAGQPSDAWITTKAKIALLSDDLVDGLAVNVDTFDGRVTIHGKLESEEAKARAEVRVREIDGVRDVRNIIAVVPEAARENTRTSDAELEKQIESVLSRDAALDESDIEVRSVNDGRVVVGGKAHSLSAHRRALEDVRSVEGVAAVVSEIESPDELADAEIWADDAEMESTLSSGGVLADAWITTKAKLLLMAEPGLSPFRVNVDTSDRVVTLFGVVPTEESRKLAENQVSKIGGVRGVENDLQVVPDVAAERISAIDDQIRPRVEERLASHAELEGGKIDVEVKDAVVRLTGTVPSNASRVTAVTVARGADGVRSVIDDLDVQATKEE